MVAPITRLLTHVILVRMACGSNIRRIGGVRLPCTYFMQVAFSGVSLFLRGGNVLQNSLSRQRPHLT